MNASANDAPIDAARPPIVVKKYANRRLYDTESSAYITLDDLAGLVRCGRELVVYDARTGDDITRAVLTQIIVEEETRGRSILPTSFLRQLIGLYGHNLQGVVPAFLERMMRQFATEQAGEGVAHGASGAGQGEASQGEVSQGEAGRVASRDELLAEIITLRAEIDRLATAPRG